MWRRADGEAPGWRGEIRTHSATGRIANRSGGLRSTASPSSPACTGSGAVTSRRGALLITQIMPIQPVISHSAISAERRPRSTRHALDAALGLHAPGGDRVGQCRVIAFGLAGVGFGEVGHGLVELA